MFTFLALLDYVYSWFTVCLGKRKYARNIEYKVIRIPVNRGFTVLIKLRITENYKNHLFKKMQACNRKNPNNFVVLVW